MRIAICNSAVPFVGGGSEALVESLRDALVAQGHDVELIRVPYSWHPKRKLLESMLFFRSLDFRSADLVIAAKFPSYYIRHPHKSVWLIHQHRQAYDLAGTEHSDFQGTPVDRLWQGLLRWRDTRVLRYANVHAISKNVADRLNRFNGVDVPVLYPPPPLLGRYKNVSDNGYVLCVGRLEPLKRPQLLLRALPLTDEAVRCKFVGIGPLRQEMEDFIAEYHLQDRAELLGKVDDATLIDLYGRAAAVYFGPVDEDYGYVTVEAMASGKPVITLSDSGGPLEFVLPRVTGWVAEPSAASIAAVLDEMARDPETRSKIGAAGQAKVADITWEKVVNALVPAQQP